MRFVRGSAIVVAGAVAAVVISAEPAAAHAVPGVQPSNFQTTVTGMTPRVRGLTVRVIDLGSQLELRNDTGTEIMVLGYQGEPYLRVGPGGVIENFRSPATFLNTTRDGRTPVPAEADPTSEPNWWRIASGTTARWHDHRVHWMGIGDPPAVARDPGRRHVIDHWRVQLRRGTQDITVTGELVWVPGPNPWWWFLGAFAAAVTLVVLSRTRSWRWVLVGALSVLVVSELAHVVGSWTATTASFDTNIGASVYAIGGIALAIVALGWILVRPSNATPAVLFAGLVVAAAGGLADLTVLTRSQVPTTLPTGVARLTVALALGLGAALAATAALRLRQPALPATVGRR